MKNSTHPQPPEPRNPTPPNPGHCEVSTKTGQLHPRIDTEKPTVPTRATAESAYQQASTALDEHNQQLGGARSRLESLKVQIASDDQILQEERELRLTYRREAAAFAGARTLREAANHLTESRIEPMASEVRGRWKHLFANNGLTFRADGSITRVRDGEELGWDTLSGGEQTWARIVTHLLVMATTTSLPFAWFDEPLEHLDPQVRHAVAATLATATRGAPPPVAGHNLRTRHRTAAGRRHRRRRDNRHTGVRHCLRPCPGVPRRGPQTYSRSVSLGLVHLPSVWGVGSWGVPLSGCSLSCKTAQTARIMV